MMHPLICCLLNVFTIHYFSADYPHVCLNQLSGLYATEQDASLTGLLILKQACDHGAENRDLSQDCGSSICYRLAHFAGSNPRLLFNSRRKLFVVCMDRDRRHHSLHLGVHDVDIATKQAKTCEAERVHG